VDHTAPIAPACPRVLVEGRHLVPGLLFRSDNVWHHIYSVSHGADRVRFMFNGPGPYTDRVRADGPGAQWLVHVPDITHLPADAPALDALDAHLADPRRWNSLCLTNDEHRLAARYSADFYRVRRPHDPRPPIDTEAAYRRALVSSEYDVANTYVAHRRWAAGLRRVHTFAQHRGILTATAC
jgi:hypothetical protein